MRKTAYLFAFCILAGLGLWIRTSATAQAPSNAGPGPIGFLITMGLNAGKAERWDGSVTVSGGKLLSLAGRHFSEEDSITAPDRWTCSTRRDQVNPYADIHYTEMRPGDIPPVLFQPVGVYLTTEAAVSRISVRTTQGNFDFDASRIGVEPLPVLNGRVSVARAPAAEKLTTGDFEDDEPAIAALPDGGLAVAWVAYRDRADRVLLRVFDKGQWSAAEEATPNPGDLFRCSVAADPTGALTVFWSRRDGDRSAIWSREKKNGAWQQAQQVSSAGSNTFHRAAASPNGNIYVVWQSYRSGQSDIYLRARRGGTWAPELQLSGSRANDWEPAIAAGPEGAYVAWDTYDRGNYDIQFRSYTGGQLSAERAITSSPKFQAHASVAVDAQNRPWIAWDESGVNWGKDQGFLIPVPFATPLHQQRSLRLAMWDGARWMEPKQGPASALPEDFRENAEHPQILFDGNGNLNMVFRHWTRRQSRTIGSPIQWENFLTRFDGARWTSPVALPSSSGPIEKVAALARDLTGQVQAAWMTDGRPFSTMIPENADVYWGALGSGPRAAIQAEALQPFSEATLEAIPVHPTEPEDVKAIRGYTLRSAGKQYRIYRGDMHRHTDVSYDFKYDGSLIEVYRYGLDSAGFDYIAPTDHQTGFDHEFTWWQNQKLVDLFHIPGSFTPLFAYERSLKYPNGHRNIIFAKRGVRTFPIPPEEASGREGAGKLFEHLRQNDGISMPHSSATSQGTDWRDNDPDIEPLMEIYQGYRNSYEYEGAPRAATRLNPHAQKSGWQPEGFWWNALAKGYRLGVQASSDHWSTHISYACLIAEDFTREGLVNAMRRRHAYAATDNIILDVRARSGGQEYMMGDVITARAAPQIQVHVIGTGAIQQVDIIRSRKFVYTSRPRTRETNFEFTDKDFTPGASYYYVRVLEENGQLAWSSPIWIK